MKFPYLVYALMSSLACKATGSDLQAIRSLYYAAVSNEDSLKLLMNKLSEKNDISTSTINGYIGMACMLQAKYDWNPYNKLSDFNKGKKMLNKAIAFDENNIELRFLRFCAQCNAPGILGYNDNIDEDKKQLLEQWSKINDDDLKARIKTYMLSCEKCTLQEKKLLI